MSGPPLLPLSLSDRTPTMPNTTQVLVLGAGAAGAAAAEVLADHDDVTTTVITTTQTAPYNRTLVNKAVATGLLEPEQAHLPPLPTPTLQDDARAIAPTEHRVRLRSGTSLHYDALIVATGSTPRLLPPEIATPEALDSGLLTALHSLDDARRVRTLIDRTRSPRVLIYGAGMIGAETAGILRQAGCTVLLAATSVIPGSTAFGPEIAKRLAQTHRTAVDTHFGSALKSIELAMDELHATFDDGRSIAADLIITALGTEPHSPPPWHGPVAVDPRLRSRDHESVYAAGGVALHERAGTPWRIDHWSDAADQGAHAARSLLADLELAEDPGPYRPHALYSAQIHHHLLVAAGHTSPLGTARTRSTAPLIITHEDADRLLAVTGLDAGPEIMHLAQQLRTPTADITHS